MTTPGWYPDPSGHGRRYWDGGQWTAATDAPALGGERRFTIHYGFALLAVFSVIGTLLFGIPLLATGSDPETEGVGVGMGIMWMLWGGMWTLIWTAFAINHTLKSRR